MNRKIYKLIDDELINFEESKHHNENDFQQLIADYPELIPGDVIDRENPRRWIVVGREIDNIDVLLLDQDGIPTIVEVKKSNNYEINREVIGQMVDYGANLFKHPIDSIIHKTGNNNLKEFLDEDTNAEKFWIQVHSNLEKEKMRLIVVSDHILPKLQNMVEFLNNQMPSVDVFAVEIKQYMDDETGIRTFIPNVFGSKPRVISFEPELTEPKFFDNLDDFGVNFYRELISFADENGFMKKWTKNGFFLTVPVEDDFVKILHCYSKLYSFDQSIFSTRSNIINRVVNGDLIFNKYLDDILKIEDFYAVNDGFGYKIENNFNEDKWETFQNILLEIKKKIMDNGLSRL